MKLSFRIALSLLVLALAARSVLAKWRGKLMSAGNSGKKALGVLVMAVGLLIITGTDRLVEGAILTASPDWLTDLTTSI